MMFCKTWQFYIGGSEQKWLFATGPQLHNFPTEDEIKYCKRISIGHNDIQDFRTDLNLPKTCEFGISQKYIKILQKLQKDFVCQFSEGSCCGKTTLPTSLGQLRQLEFLKLSGFSHLKNLPANTGNFSRLIFLNLEDCESLNSLLDGIRELRNLKHLKLEGCGSLVIPHATFHFTQVIVVP